MKNDVDLTVRIDAKFQWLSPPKDTPESAGRDAANCKLQSLALKLENITKMMLVEMMEIQSAQHR